jgi:N-acetyl-anhydromuramyl-L-alanine amidase AmpD
MMTAPVMDITRRSPNFWANRRYPYAPYTVGFCEAIVEHVTEGSLESSLNELINGAVSANYVISEDGKIFELVPPQHAAWANGIWEAPNTSLPIIANHYNKSENMNLFTIGIEHVGRSFDNPNDPLAHNFMNPIQYRATLVLQIYLCQTYHIVPSRNTMLRHADIQSRQRANCPGARFPLDQLITEVGNNVQANPPLQPNTSSWHSSETGFDVKDGFLMLFNYRGGIDTCGYPITNQFVHKETGLLTQIFEKCAFDYDPSAPEKYRIRNTNIGRAYLDLIGGVQNLILP